MVVSDDAVQCDSCQAIYLFSDEWGGWSDARELGWRVDQDTGIHQCHQCDTGEKMLRRCYRCGEDEFLTMKCLCAYCCMCVKNPKIWAREFQNFTAAVALAAALRLRGWSGC